MEKKYQVFISSTYGDLIDERRAVIEIILAMGHIPAGMELFSAGNQEQWDVIQERINECDYYIVIVAGRYGSITEEKLSYTRKEYEYAREIGIPVAGFLLDPKTFKSWPLDKCDPENSQLLESFRARVESLPVNYWHNTGDLKAQCAVALPKLIRHNSRSGWVSGDEVIDSKMVSEFTRLSSENERLRTELDKLKTELTELKPKIDLDALEATLNSIQHTLLITKGYSEPIEEYETVSLFDIYLVCAPSMLIEISDKDLRRTMLYASTEIDKYFNEKSGNEYCTELNEPLANKIIGELVSCGLIEPSIKKRSLKAGHEYWTLTKIGEQIYKKSAKK